MKLDDFAKHEMAKRCKLTKPEVLALRFYTTHGFRTINWGLRDRDRLQRGEKHPLPVMTFLLHSGAKKLFTVAAISGASMPTIHLFRGMSNVALESDFMVHGGTELAPMSTDTDLRLAIKYSCHGSQAVLFRIRTTAGGAAKLTWLSAFPFEEEELFPPGTFLKPLRPHPHLFKIGNTIFHVVDFEPRLM